MTNWENFKTRVAERPLIPTLKESWREYLILTLMLGGGALMPVSWLGAIPLLVGASISAYQINKNSSK